MTREQIEAEHRRYRLATAEALAGMRHVRTVHRGRKRSTFVGRDVAEVERMRVEVHELRCRGLLGPV